MFAGVLDKFLEDVDENSSCKKLSLFQAKRLLSKTFEKNLLILQKIFISLFTRTKFEGNLFLRDLRNLFVLYSEYAGR